VKKDDDKGIMK